MIIVLKPHAKKEDLKEITAKIKGLGLRPIASEGTERKVIHVLGDTRRVPLGLFKAFRSVEKAIRVLKPYKLTSKEHQVQKTVIKVGGLSIGGDEFAMIAGPCSAESEEQVMETARHLKKMGVKILRASCFKPRTSPYEFQGLGIKGLKILDKVRKKTGLLVETEVMDLRDVKVASECVDILRVGARNMQNYDLLKELGKVRNPVILKRGMSATIREFIMAAEYIILNGNKNVILCERGIRTFETAYRNTLDISAVALLKCQTHLPVIVDPSHAAGRRDLIGPLSRAAVAAGADGLLVEMHPWPEKALCDGAQSLTPERLSDLIEELRPICGIMKKRL